MDIDPPLARGIGGCANLTIKTLTRAPRVTKLKKANSTNMRHMGFLNSGHMGKLNGQR